MHEREGDRHAGDTAFRERVERVAERVNERDRGYVSANKIITTTQRSAGIGSSGSSGGSGSSGVHLKERLSNTVGDRLIERVGDRLIERVGDRLIERVGDRVSESLSGRVDDRERLHRSRDGGRHPPSSSASSNSPTNTSSSTFLRDDKDYDYDDYDNRSSSDLRNNRDPVVPKIRELGLGPQQVFDINPTAIELNVISWLSN